VWRLSDVATKIPLAVKGGPSDAHEARWTRALVTRARLHLQGSARRHNVIFDQGCWDGPTRWWLDPQASTVVVPANTTMAVTADARAKEPIGWQRWRRQLWEPTRDKVIVFAQGG
jgi:hypothetical protein